MIAPAPAGYCPRFQPHYRHLWRDPAGQQRTCPGIPQYPTREAP